METGAYVERMRLDGSHPALDFVNTLGGLRDAPSQLEDEHLRGYLDVAVFASRVELLGQASLERLLRRARRHPDEAKSVFRRALELRSLVDGVFRPIAHDQTAPGGLLSELREAERTALAHASLEHGAEAYRWTWPDDALEAPLWLVTNAAVDLLTIGPLGHLQLCGRCRWLFLDLSKNRSRRWCSMAECGTATKKLRYVERRRARRSGRSRSTGA
jgi:predicted RNA-binding Zn ribbon-like protein